MASSYFKRLEKKYYKENLTGKKYQALIQDILIHNNMKIGRAIGRLSDSHYQQNVRKLSKKKQKIIKLPDIEEVLPKRSVFLIKAAENGNIISTTLRTKLEKDLRDTLKEFQKIGLPKMEIKRGVSTGKINPLLIQQFQKKLTGTFEEYTKKDKITGIPGNVRNISITEIRSTIGMIKDQYKNELLRKNPQIKMTKTWLHNKRLSKKPRLGHMKLNNMTINVEAKFRVDRDDESGYDLMDRPHDINAPAKQKIGCSCDLIYKAIIP